MAHEERHWYAEGMDAEEWAFQRLYGPVLPSTPVDCAELMQGDLTVTLPMLDDRRRTWLRDMVAHLHPGHSWLESI